MGGMRRWCCSRRDTRGKRGYDDSVGAGMTVVGTRVWRWCGRGCDGGRRVWGKCEPPLTEV